jgi:hypothetical protein
MNATNFPVQTVTSSLKVKSNFRLGERSALFGYHIPLRATSK